MGGGVQHRSRADENQHHAYHDDGPEEYEYYSEDSIEVDVSGLGGTGRSVRISPGKRGGKGGTQDININVTSPPGMSLGDGGGGLNRPRRVSADDSPSISLTPEKPVNVSSHQVNQELYSNDWNIDQTCIFCGEQNPTFTKRKLDVHYFQDCPVLTSCPACKETVEIASLHDHLLDEREKRGSYKVCPRCKEPVHNTDYPSHVAARDCRVAKDPKRFSRCPLCHDDISPGEKGWITHLMVNGCPNNDRTRP